MMLATNTLKSTIRRRPWTTLTVSTASTIGGYLAVREYSNEAISPITIPRHRYDATSIENYWSQRPLSAVRRVVSIVGELGPVAAEYLYRFHLRPKLRFEPSTDREAEVRELAQKLRGALTKLGPTFIKVNLILLLTFD